jgi:hypothetical protein
MPCPSETCQVEVSAEREELYEILKRRLFDTDPAQIKKPGRGAQPRPIGTITAPSPNPPLLPILL